MEREDEIRERLEKLSKQFTSQDLRDIGYLLGKVQRLEEALKRILQEAAENLSEEWPFAIEDIAHKALQPQHE